MKVWRITDRRYADSAFTGAGAEQYGGRFNSVGRRVIYTAGSLSLAMLETLVQANDRGRLLGHVVLWTEVDQQEVAYLNESDLPSDWRVLPYRSATKEVGDQWLDRRESLVLGVPSVVVPQERNYLINPGHPAFSTLEFSRPVPAGCDPRLLGL